MYTKKEMPWVEYLVLDETTRKRKLREDTPSDIREKYEVYEAELAREKQQGKMLPK